MERGHSSRLVRSDTYARCALLLETNFYEKAHFVKPTWRLCVVARAHSLFSLRAMLLSALSASQLSGGSVHMMRSVLIRTERVLPSSQRSSLLEGGPSSHSAVTLRSEAHPGKKPCSPCATFWGRSFRYASSLHLLCVASLSAIVSFPKPPPTLGADARCRVARRPPPLSTDGAKARLASSPRPPPLVSWRSWLRGRLSSVRGV
jgi:hypothetical protein